MGLLFLYEVIPNDYARIRAFLKDYKHLQGIRFYLKFDFFLEVENQMKEAKEELQLIKDKISGVYSCFSYIHTSLVKNIDFATS